MLYSPLSFPLFLFLFFYIVHYTMFFPLLFRFYCPICYSSFIPIYKKGHTLVCPPNAHRCYLRLAPPLLRLKIVKVFIPIAYLLLYLSLREIFLSTDIYMNPFIFCNIFSLLHFIPFVNTFFIFYLKKKSTTFYSDALLIVVTFRFHPSSNWYVFYYGHTCMVLLWLSYLTFVL